MNGDTGYVSVKFNAGLAIFILICGVATLGIGLMIGKGMSLITGGICTLMGILWLVNPTIVKEGPCIKVKNPLGMTLKTFPYSDPSQLHIEAGTVWYRESPASPPVKVCKKSFAFDSAGWAALIRAIESEKNT